MSSSRSTEELWQAFFANPLDWWDNRTNKVRLGLFKVITTCHLHGNSYLACE